MNRTLIIYEGKNDFTEQIAKNLSLILGPAKYCKPEDLKKEYWDFDNFVIFFSVYGDVVPKGIMEFVKANKDLLSEKRIALFCSKYSETLERLLGDSIVWKGESGEDFDMNYFISCSLQIKKKFQKPKMALSREKLKSCIEEFLSGHNTCTLSSCSNEMVRGTPIEYMYNDGAIYMLSEGGIKFANILMNNNVSVSVYDNYTGMNKLGGLQISGTASIIDSCSEEYKKVVKLKGLNPDKIAALPINLNLIRIDLKSAEFLWSEFGKQGFDSKQYFQFT